MKIEFGKRGSGEVSHLFPPLRIGEYELSAQADRAGYLCTPRERHEDIREYEDVEVTVWARGQRLIPSKCDGFRKDIAGIFDEEGIARYVSHEGVAWIAGYLKELADAGITMETRVMSGNPIALTDSELDKLLMAIDGARFADQWDFEDPVDEAVTKLLLEARERGIDILQYGELHHLVPAAGPTRG